VRQLGDEHSALWTIASGHDRSDGWDPRPRRKRNPHHGSTRIEPQARIVNHGQALMRPFSSWNTPPDGRPTPTLPGLPSDGRAT